MGDKAFTRTPKTISIIADEIASSTLNIDATRIRAKAKVASPGWVAHPGPPFIFVEWLDACRYHKLVVEAISRLVPAVTGGRASSPDQKVTSCLKGITLPLTPRRREVGTSAAYGLIFYAAREWARDILFGQ